MSNEHWVGISKIGDNYQVQLNLNATSERDRVKHRHRVCSLRSNRQPTTTPWVPGLPKNWKGKV